MPATGGAPKALTTGDHTITGWNYDAGADRHVFGSDEATQRRRCVGDGGARRASRRA